MRNLTLTLAALLLIVGNVFARKLSGPTTTCAGRDVTVQAESSAEPRRTVMDMFPGAVVGGVHRIK